MDDDAPPPIAPFPRGLKLALTAVLAVGGAAMLYTLGAVVFHPGSTLAPGEGPPGAAMAATPRRAPTPEDQIELPPLAPKGEGERAPTVAFKDGAGRDARIADYKGKVVVLNLWATWCGPCRKEMPTLAALQALSAGKAIKVLPLSVDTAAKTAAAKAFIAQNAPLDFHQDLGPNLPFALKPPVLGFPTTVIFDKAGRERKRIQGDLDWSSPRVRRVLDALAAE